MDDWEVVDIPDHPLKREQWVAIVVEIRENASGVVRELPDVTILEDGQDKPNSFFWKTGNLSCDCNRSLFFARAAGEDENLAQHDCGNSAYSIRVRNKRSGRVFYSEYVLKL